MVLWRYGARYGPSVLGLWRYGSMGSSVSVLGLWRYIEDHRLVTESDLAFLHFEADGCLLQDVVMAYISRSLPATGYSYGLHIPIVACPQGRKPDYLRCHNTLPALLPLAISWPHA